MRVESKPTKTNAAPEACSIQQYVTYVRELGAGLPSSGHSLQITSWSVPDKVIENRKSLQHNEYFTETNIHNVRTSYSRSHAMHP